MSTKDKKADEEWQKERRKLMPLFFAQMLVSVVILVIVYYGGYFYCDYIPLPESNDFSSKLQFTLQWCAFPFAVILFYTIMQVGNKRGSSPASNPLSGNEHYVQLDKNILANTLEQTVLAFFLVLTLTVYLQQAEMKLVPLFVVSFVVGRVLFIAGYKISPKFRSCGVLTNFGSTFVVLAIVGYYIYSRGFMIAATGKDEL